MTVEKWLLYGMSRVVAFISAVLVEWRKQIESSTRRTETVDPATSNFIDTIRTPALAIEAVTGIPWRFAMVQACHESAHGTSALTRNANNLFGVTADDVLAKAGIPATMGMEHVKAWLIEHPEVPAIIMKTGEYSPHPPEQVHYWSRPNDVVSKVAQGKGSDLVIERPFRRYDDWMGSLQDWAARIQRRYPLALAAAKAGNFAKFAAALQGEGYATDPKYAEQLIALNTLLQDLA